ncbi:MAG: hypothetical protein HGA55_02570 [Methanoregulaceae archaeon]|nr:hypothetical protein [Methanoregulaceae archaeon]
MRPEHVSHERVSRGDEEDGVAAAEALRKVEGGQVTGSSIEHIKDK